MVNRKRKSYSTTSDNNNNMAVAVTNNERALFEENEIPEVRSLKSEVRSLKSLLGFRTSQIRIKKRQLHSCYNKFDKLMLNNV